MTLSWTLAHTGISGTATTYNITMSSTVLGPYLNLIQ
jgi:hypothetical protein